MNLPVRWVSVLRRVNKQSCGHPDFLYPVPYHGTYSWRTELKNHQSLHLLKALVIILDFTSFALRAF